MHAHTVGHETLEVGNDRAIRGGQCIVARFHPPGRVGRLRLRKGLAVGLLRRVQDAGASRGNVAGKVMQEGFLSQPALITVEHDQRLRARWRTAFPSAA